MVDRCAVVGGCREGIGNLAVYFLRTGEVEVFVTSMVLGHPKYPLTGPEAGSSVNESPVWIKWKG